MIAPSIGYRDTVVRKRVEHGDHEISERRGPSVPAGRQGDIDNTYHHRRKGMLSAKVSVQEVPDWNHRSSCTRRG